MTQQIPIVDYLRLVPTPHLEANECVKCQARFFDHRNACAKCSGTQFHKVEISTEGTLTSFTIVSLASSDVPVPFISAIVDCKGTSVRGNLVNLAPDPKNIRLGMPVKLTTFPIRVDSRGTEAIGFGFEKVERAS